MHKINTVERHNVQQTYFKAAFASWGVVVALCCHLVANNVTMDSDNLQEIDCDDNTW